MYSDTCAEPACGRLVGPKGAKGLCPSHYKRLQISRHTIPCRVQGCEKTAQTRGYCPMHYQRQRINGEVGSAEPSKTYRPPGICEVEDCGQPRRKGEWCASHYSQMMRIGSVKPFGHKWAKKSLCLVCGRDSAYSYRQFCSGACRALWRTHAGQVPQSVQCSSCSGSIDLTVRTKRGYRQRTDTLLCRRCKQDKRKHGLSVELLARRDGLACGICSTPVNMSLNSPDQMRASVDHILPRALGGTNDPVNLQLTHLLCNVRKGHRVTT